MKKFTLQILFSLAITSLVFWLSGSFIAWDIGYLSGMGEWIEPTRMLFGTMYVMGLFIVMSILSVMDNH